MGMYLVGPFLCKAAGLAETTLIASEGVLFLTPPKILKMWSNSKTTTLSSMNIVCEWGGGSYDCLCTSGDESRGEVAQLHG